MKIIQLNGWCGRLNGPLSEFIKDEQPDILCMQETFAPHPTIPRTFQDQYCFVDETITAGGFGYNFFAPVWGLEMAGSLIDVGNIILSKYPLSAQATSHTYNHYYIKKSSQDSLPNTRAWQACQVELPNGKQLSVANYQGYLTPEGSMGDEITIKTMQKVRDGLSLLPKPLIFCGDLNVNPKSPALKVLDSLGLINLTIRERVKTTLSPVHRAPLAARNSVACDYIFVSEDIQVNKFQVSDTIVSDHKALILEFDI